MAKLAIGTYLKFTDFGGNDVGFYMQNFHHQETRIFQGQPYIFGNFAFSGTVVDLEASSVSASIVTSLTELSLATFRNAVNFRWYATVRTVWLDVVTFAEKGVWLTEVYAITAMSHDSLRLSLQLGSPLDAITAQFPRNVLTKCMVGDLPSTGSINLL